MTKEHYGMEGKKKGLFIIAILLSVLFLSSSVFAAAMEDPARIKGSSPTGSDVVNDTGFATRSINILTDDTVFQYPLGFGCSDYLMTAGEELTFYNGTLKEPSRVSIITGVGSYTDNGNSTHTFEINGQSIINVNYLGGMCKNNNYVFLYAYKDASCYGGNYIYVPYASWQYKEPALPTPPTCTYNAYPLTGVAPLDVAFTDTSGNVPTSWDWLIKTNGTSSDTTHSTLQNAFATLHYAAAYDVTFNATNSFGTCSRFDPNSLNVLGSPAGSVTFDLYAVDAITHNAISGSTLSIQNLTSNSWKNVTSPSGSVTFTSSDGAANLPLSIGQVLNTAATAYGYKENNVTISIPYSGYSSSIALMPNTAVNATGTFWLTVKVTKNEDGTPLSGAIVQVISGGNNYQTSTYSDGVVTLQNITASTTFSVTAFAQAYAAQTKVLPVTADFMNVSFSLVRIGATPVATPKTPVPTGTPAPIITDPSTGKPYVDSHGNQVSAPEGNALDAFAKLSAALGAFFSIGISIILMWLMWVLVYEITGGKVLDKLMRRGRR